MVIISEIISVTGLILKANGFLFHIPDNWYKGNSEIKSFKSELRILSERATQWEKQLKQHGMSEDSVLTSFLAQAYKLLDEEEEYYDAHRKSPVWKFRRKLFPGKLTYILTDVRKIVETGPQLLQEAVETDDLLAKRFRTGASELPFGHDPQYVPLQNAVEVVRKALEDVTGPQIVTLHGEPGMGKSALAKYIALLYQDMIWGSTASSFDSVQYLFCGRGCTASTKQLRRAFLSDLGLGAILGTREDGQDGEYSDSLSSYQSALRRALRHRRGLIILDDVWEEDFEVLACMISRGSPCRYLLTSQSKNVWHGALCIQMPAPTEEEALKIFYNHLRGYSRSADTRADSHSLTGGSSSDSHQDVSSSSRHTWRPSANTSLHASSSGSQPEASSSNNDQWRLSSTEQAPFLGTDLKDKIHDLIRILESHPLSLVNVAVSVSRNGSVDVSQLKNLADNIFTFLDKNRHVGRILVNERPYSLTVSASMMLMVDSLREAERDVLFLLAVLRRHIGSYIFKGAIPNCLVRFFIRRLYRVSASDAIFKYSSALDYLEDNSLVQVQRENDEYLSVNSTRLERMTLSMHNLRREYIKQRHLMSLQGIASTIMAVDSDVGGDLRLPGSLVVNVQDAGQCLAIAMGVVYFDDAFAEELALPFQSVMANMSLNEDAIGYSDGHQLHPEQVLHSLAVSGAVNWNGNVIPRGLDQLVDARELVRSARDFFDRYSGRENARDRAISRIMELLNLIEDPNERWKQQVHHDASKVMMKLLCRNELDDSSMASLLTIPHTIEAACALIHAIYIWLYRDQVEDDWYHWEQHEGLSKLLPATWKALSRLVYSDSVSLQGRCDPCVLPWVWPCETRPSIINCLLEFESHDRILVELHKLREVADKTNYSSFQNAIYDGFLSLHLRRLTSQMLSGSDLQELLVVILWKTIDDLEHVRYSLGHEHAYLYERCTILMVLLAKDSVYVQKLLTVPHSWKETIRNSIFFRRLLKFEALVRRHPDVWICDRMERDLSRHHKGNDFCFSPAPQIGASHPGWPASLLRVLSGTLEFQAEAVEVLNQAHWAEEDFSSWPESSSMGLAGFWSNVALLPNLTDSVRLGLITIAKRWMAELRKYDHGGIIRSFPSPLPVHWPSSEVSGCPCRCRTYVELLEIVEEVAKAVTIISVLHGHASSLLATEISTLEGLQERWTKMCASCALHAGVLYVRIWKGQMQAYCQMEMYDKALSYLNRVEAACFVVHAKRTSLLGLRRPYFKHYTPEFLHTYFRSYGVLIQALSKNYAGATISLHRLQEAARASVVDFCLIESDHHWQFFMCTNRGVLSKLSGEFSKAVHEFDQSLEHWSKMTSKGSWDRRGRFWGGDSRIHNFVKCQVLQHRCRAKELMQDFEGSKLDLKAAKALRLRSDFLEPVTWRYTFVDAYDDMWIRTLEYSLLQLPANQ